MRLGAKLFGRGEPPPEPPGWAAFFDARDYDAFQKTVKDDLARRGFEYELTDDGGAIRLTGKDVPDGSFGLGNLAQMCHRTPRRRWSAIIKQHFDRVIDTFVNSEDTLEAFGSDFEVARPNLKIRLFPADLANQEIMTFQIPADGILAALVYDLPDSVASVHADHVKAWGVPNEELFRIGLENVKADGLIRAVELPGHGGAVVNILSSESFFTATHALFIDEYLPKDLELGALVAVPNRHAVLFHPILDSHVMGALEAMIPAAAGMFEQGPGSVSPHVYWWNEGKFQRQPAEITDQGIDFQPTEEFIYQILNRVR